MIITVAVNYIIITALIMECSVIIWLYVEDLRWHGLPKMVRNIKFTCNLNSNRKSKLFVILFAKSWFFEKLPIVLPNFLFIHSIIGLEEIARMLLEKGVDVNTRNKRNSTALTIAVSGGKTKFQMNSYCVHLIRKRGLQSTLNLFKKWIVELQYFI